MYKEILDFDEKTVNDLRNSIKKFGEKITFPKGAKRITLYYLLHDILPACNYVEITDGGWRVGFTYIDYEDLFFRSLNSKMLTESVKSVILHESKDFTKPIYTVDIY